MKQKLSVLLLASVVMAALAVGAVRYFKGSSVAPLKVRLYTIEHGHKIYTNVCNLAGSGDLKAEASGFTPGGTHTTEAHYPNGKLYTYMLDFNARLPGGVGPNSNSGSLPTWDWNCKNGANGTTDPTGRYPIKITDNPTGRSLSFKIRTVNRP